MKYIYKPKCSTTLNLEDTNIEVFMKKLKHLLYESYTRTRIDQLFNIIIGKQICPRLTLTMKSMILFILNSFMHIFVL
jgi:hypothetical protein